MVLMLTARDTNRDKMVGLHQGAGDYMVKPFDPDVLRARVQALLRRAGPPLTSAMASTTLPSPPPSTGCWRP